MGFAEFFIASFGLGILFLLLAIYFAKKAEKAREEYDRQWFI